MRVTLVVALLAGLMLACSEGTDCRPTTTTAQRANKVDLSDPGASSILTARVTTRRGKPLSGLSVRVEVLDDGDPVFTDKVDTDDDGVARLNLAEQVDVSAIEGVARGDAWSATFPGNSTYCASDDRAGFKTVNLP